MKQTSIFKRLLSMALAVALCLSVLPWTALAAGTDEAPVYTKITSGQELVSGEYVMIATNGYAPLVYDNGKNAWITTAQPVVSGDSVTDAAGAVWTITVSGTGVTLKDSAGTCIAPKGGNNNGIISGEYSWNVTCADGLFTFAGTGEDTVVLASNSGSANKFRAYKATTAAGNPKGYATGFALYKLVEAEEPPVNPSEDTTPPVTVVDIATALAGEDNAEFTVTGVVTLLDGKNIYIQDATGGICIRAGELPADLTLGDTITASGAKSVYNGLIQLSGSYEKSSGLTLAAKETTIGALTTADICTYVTIKGLKVTEISGDNTTLSDGTNTIKLYKGKFGDTAVAVGDQVDFTGAVGVYKTTLQLRNTLPSELVVIPAVQPPVDPTPDPEPDPEPAGTTAELVTDVSQLKAGDEIILVATGSDFALSTEQKSNNRGQAAITREGTAVTYGEDTQVITLEAGLTEGTFAMKTDAGYLYAASSSKNYLRSEESVTANSSWTIEIAEGVATIKATGENTRNWLRHNATSKLFACYASGQNDVSIYKLVKGGSEEEKPTGIADGNYVIWAPAYNMALSTVYGGFYNSGVAVTLENEKLSGYGATEIWTVTNNDDGTITISCESGKLSMDTGFSSMPLNKVNDTWTLEDAGNGLWYVKNVGRDTYIEWYADKNNWSSYYKISEGSEGLFALRFTPAETAEEPAAPAVADGKYVLWVGGEYNKALSSTYPNGSYYNAGVDITVDGDKISGYGTTEIWTVTNNDDGTITISCEGGKLSMDTGFSSMPLNKANDTWTIEDAGNGAYYVKNVGREQYIQWRDGEKYNYFSAYYLSEKDNFAIHFTPAEEVSSGLIADGDYVIWAPAYNMALSTVYGGYYNNGVALTVNGDKLSGYEATEVWTVKNNDDGTITISCTEGKLSMDTGFSSMPLNKVNDTWTVEDAGNGAYYVKNVGRECYIEWYAGNKYWSGYYKISEGSEGMFALKFTPVVKGYETDGSVVENIAQWGGMTNAANTASVSGDKYVSGDEKDSTAQFTAVVGGSVVTPYTKGGNDEAPLYYMGGTGLGSGTNDYMQFAVNAAGWGNMELSFRLRSSNSGPGSFQLQYSVDGGTAWQNFTTGTYAYAYTAWSSDGSYPVTGEGAIADGVAKTSYAPANYVSFTFDVPAGADNCAQLLIRLVPGTEKANGKTGAISASGTVRIDSVVLSGSPIVDGSITGYVTVTPNGEEDQAVGTALTMTSATENAVISYRVNGGEWTVYDPANKPTLATLPCNIEAKAAAQGKADSVSILYAYSAGTVENVKMSPNGGGLYISGESAEIKLSTNTDGAAIYYATSADGVTFGGYALYTDPIVVNKGFGKLVVKAYALKDGFKPSAEITRTFTERSTDSYALYFGQLHSHTNISDGSGSVTEAFQHASSVKNLDFLAVTDHSNSFDGEGSGVLAQDGSSVSAEWKEGHEAAAAVTDGDFVGLYGFEMTWSNGLGHINTFNTPGWQSRTQAEYKTQSTALQNYYNALATVPESISQFNHPGTTFGDFSDFAHYSELTDGLITLIEVGNGEGAIGSSGYFPSYEYYTRALDKGWHVAPTNNQDNHKGLWGDANTGRSVVLADSLTEEGIYDALRNYRVYATEDNDLSIYYSLDGSIMGSILQPSDVGETVKISVTVSDPTDAVIGTVEVIVNGGLSIAQQTVSASSQTVAFDVPSNYNYYYIKITQADGDIAVTAPVWVGQVEAVGISSFTAQGALTIAGEEQTFTMDLFNNENKALDVDSVVFTDKATGEVIYTDTTITSVPKTGTASCSFSYTFPTDGMYTLAVTVKGALNGVEKTYTKDLELTVMPKNVTSNVIVDGTHYNDYVNGYYGGNTANMTSIAADQGVKVHVETKQITAEMLADCDLLVISAPAKKSGTANAGAYEAKPFEDDFIQMVADYVKNGGNVIVCGLADYQDKGSASADLHTAAQINKLLAAMGSTMTINDDEAYDEVSNGGQAYRLYPENFNAQSKWTAGILEGQTYSQYSGCTVNPGNGTWLVKGFDTTYSIDSDGDGIGGIEKGEAVFLAAEETPYGGTIFAAGGVFVSDFEVKAELDNIWDLPYANRTIYENILGITRTQPAVTPIAEVRASTQEGLGRIFVIEGYVTAGTANKNTTFFDAIYLQDATGGITVFPYSAEGLELGTKMRVTGYTDQYQGDKEIQILSYEILDEEKNVLSPEKVTNSEAMDYDANGGALLQVEGKVVEITMSSGVVSQFVVRDEKGDLAKVFIDGYILSGTKGTNELTSIVKLGNTVSAVGLLYLHPEGDSTESVAVLRVRDCDEVLLVKEGTGSGDNAPTGDVTLMPAVMVMTVSALALAVLVLDRKRRAAK